jgi:hypothetical protein
MEVLKRPLSSGFFAASAVSSAEPSPSPTTRPTHNTTYTVSHTALLAKILISPPLSGRGEIHDASTHLVI